MSALPRTATMPTPRPFHVAPDPRHGVTWHLIRCPKCGSTDTRVTSTVRPVRYHRCRGCGWAFKSVEK